MGDFEKKFPASACRKKKIACSTNVIESLWEKKVKNVLPTRLLEKKKILMTRNHPPLPSRVKWSAPNGIALPLPPPPVVVYPAFP